MPVKKSTMCVCVHKEFYVFIWSMFLTSLLDTTTFPVLTVSLGVGSLFSCSVCQFFYSTLSHKNITTGVMANTRIIFLGIITVLLNPWIEKILYVVSWLLRTLDLLQTHPENNLCNLSGQLLLIACSEMVDKDKSCTVTDQQCAIQEL